MPKSDHFCGPTICYACEKFDTDGLWGDSPECTVDWKPMNDCECEEFKKGVPSSMPVHQRDCQRGFRDACAKLGV